MFPFIAQVAHVVRDKQLAFCCAPVDMSANKEDQAQLDPLAGAKSNFYPSATSSLRFFAGLSNFYKNVKGSSEKFSKRMLAAFL